MGVCFSVERWDLQQTPAALPQPAEAGEAFPEEDGSAKPEVVALEDSQAPAAGRSAEAGSGDCYGPVSGQLIAAMKEACRHAFQAQATETHGRHVHLRDHVHRGGAG